MVTPHPRSKPSSVQGMGSALSRLQAQGHPIGSPHSRHFVGLPALLRGQQTVVHGGASGTPWPSSGGGGLPGLPSPGEQVAKTHVPPAPQLCLPRLSRQLASGAQGRKGFGKGQDSRCHHQDTERDPEHHSHRVDDSPRSLLRLVGTAWDPGLLRVRASA